MSVNELKEIIDNILQQRRFLLVIDDVWSISDWQDVRNIVPVNDCGSRLMVTTRKIDVASASQVQTNGVVYSLEPLSQEESWTLFCRKAFPESCLCPPHLKEISQRILSKCEGLPLAIVVIAGVLATKDESKITEWLMFEQSLPSELNINERLERVKRLLFLSYYDLPYHLKICFLYMSLFPEDEQIQKMTLVRLWIAEGFVQAREGMSIEDVAEEYLNELVNRSLVQVVDHIDKYTSGVTKLKFRLHDLLREMILSISKEHRFTMVASGSTTEWPETVRRLAIHKDVQNSQVSSEKFNHLRSFLTFGSRKSLKLLMPIFLRSKFLKVLDLKNAQLDEIPQEVFGLVHLRFLSLSGTKVRTIPISIGNLEKLETLDLRETKVTSVPKEIVKLVRLRHLLVGYNSSAFNAPSNIGAILSLQTLVKVNVREYQEVVLREIGRLSQLRKLVIGALRREHGMTLCSSISKLTNLRSLDLSSVGEGEGEGEEVLNLESLHALQFLERFYSRGRIDKAPDWTSFPSLISMNLYGCRLKDGSDLLTNSMQALPNLLHLDLFEASDGDSLCFKAGGFPRLTNLDIGKFEGLKTVTIEEGAMPHLDSLLICGCKLLDVVPLGIEHLTKLRELHLVGLAVGDSLCFKAGWFPRLRHLRMCDLERLKTVTIEEGAMPQLDSLEIRDCELLDGVPFCIEHITKLEHLYLRRVATNLMESVKQKDGDYWRIAHVPQVIVEDMYGIQTMVRAGC